MVNYRIMTVSPDPLDILVAAVRSGAKYSDVCDELVRAIGTRELRVRRNLKEALKATRNKLHQVGAAYIQEPPRYLRWLDELRAAQAEGPQALRAACVRVMHTHASARERLPILDEFYAATLAGVGPIHSVLDIACGLNPLAIPWMPLAPGCTYYTYDIYLGLRDFLQGFFEIIGQPGRAEAADVLHPPPLPVVDVAYLLKAIPCLEQLDKEAAARLLETIRARHLLVSFPVHSLGGREKHMVEHYEAHFYELLADRPWTVRRYEFSSELAFLVSKGEGSQLV